MSTPAIRKPEKVNKDGVSQERILYDRLAFQKHPSNTTESKLRIVARETAKGTVPKELANILNLSVQYVSTLVRTVRANGMLEEMHEKLDDVVVKLEKENTLFFYLPIYDDALLSDALVCEILPSLNDIQRYPIFFQVNLINFPQYLPLP